MTTNITIVGNATRDPELRFTPAGVAVVSFGVAVNRRKKDGDKWVDDGADFYNVTAWRELGQNVAETVEKGTRVVVTGRLSQRQWETDAGEKRTSIEVNADEVGPSLRWASAKVSRNERSDKSSSSQQNGPPAFDPSEEPF